MDTEERLNSMKDVNEDQSEQSNETDVGVAFGGQAVACVRAAVSGAVSSSGCS